MKKIIAFLTALMLITGVTYAQLDRTKAPAPQPAKPIQLTPYQSFTLKNGLRVFVIENHKIPKVSISLELDNDPVREGQKAGLLDIYGELLGAGTKTRSKEQLDEETDFIGATLATSPDGMYGSALSKYKDKLAALMNDVLLNASFPADELDKIKKQFISGLESDKDDPAAISGNVAQVLNFGKNHPYGEIKTPATVENVTVADCKAYHKKYMLPNNAYLAIVGDVSLAEAQALANTYFGKWKKGKVIKATYPLPQASAGDQVALVDRPQSVQSLIRITYPVVLKPYSPEEVKVDVMNQILGGGFSARLMQNLREKYGYTYGVGSRIFSDKVIGRFTTNASVRNEVTDSALIQYMYELNRINTELVSDAELNAAKASISGDFARSLEDPRTIAGFAISTHKYGLSPDFFKNYLKSVEAVTKEDVLAAAQKYITPDNANIIVVGKASEVADKLAAFGEVKYYDVYGNLMSPKSKVTTPEGLTGEAVIEKYLQSIGGKDSLSALSHLSIILEGDAAGQPIGGRRLFSAPGKYLQELTLSGMVLSKTVSDGEKVQSTQMGMPMPASADNLVGELVNNHPYPEMLYTLAGVKVVLKGADVLDGKNVYIVEVTKPGSEAITTYFDATTGFKLREEESMETPMGNMTITTDYLEYKPIGGGLLFPEGTKQKVGPQLISIKNKSVEVNKALDDALFKVN